MLKARIFFTFLVAGQALLLLNCKTPSNTCLDPSKINKEGICTLQYDPVCGCNNQTYSNACQATNAGVTSFQPGECPK